MNALSFVMAIFALLGAFDRIIGNKLRLGEEFEKGLQLLGTLMLSMTGMLVLSPVFSTLLQPLLTDASGFIDPSVIPALLFANDMGGASMSLAVANDPLLGKFNGLVVSSMMGATISFTIPYALGVVQKEQHQTMFLGFLCGIVTIPLGCFVGGLILQVPILQLLCNLVPLVVLAALVMIGLLKIPKICVKIFSVIGVIIKILVTVGLAIGIFQTLTGINLVPYAQPIEENVMIIVNTACVLSGAFPLLRLVTKILNKPLTFFGGKIGINATSAVGLFSTVTTNVTTFGLMKEMDDKGATMSAAFAVSGAFTLGSHLAFTLAFSPDCTVAVLVAKLVAGIAAAVVAALIVKNKKNKDVEKNNA